MTTVVWQASSGVVDARTGRRTAWGEHPRLELGGPTVAAVPHSVDALPFVQAHLANGAELLVTAQARLDDALTTRLTSEGFTVVLGDRRVPAATTRPGERGRLWLLTSGTTGRPKQIGHSIASLTTVTGPQPPRRWLCPYSPGTYAWWQVVTLGLTQPEQDVVMLDPADSEDWPDAALENAVTAVSGTPTFWRQALLRHGDLLGRLPLQQVTLGGEPVDQPLLDELRALLPAARISWIYASSELGATIAVHDGRAGFPVEWLHHRVPGRPVLAVHGEELVVSSPHHGVGQDGARPTGDRVVVRDGRVHVVGRIDGDELNVGGAKVSAAAVREVLTSHPVVAWARVSGRRAPVVGAMVTAEVVLAGWPRLSRDAGSALLAEWCRGRLPAAAVPRIFRFHDEVPPRETLKSDV